MIPKSDAAQYATSHPNTTLLPNGKLRFDQTGMEFPPTVTTKVLEAYARGRAFRRAVTKRMNDQYDFSVHEPHIVPHKIKDESHFLYCTLTKVTLPRNRDTVLNHVSAKRFRRRLQDYEEAKKQQELEEQKAREQHADAKAKAKCRSETGKAVDSEGDDEDEQDSEDEVMQESPEFDVLDGVLSSDDDEDADTSDMRKGRDSTVTDGAGRSNGVGNNGTSDWTEEMADDEDVFWTRGRDPARLDGGAEDEVDDEGPEQARKRSRKRTKQQKSTMTQHSEIQAEESVLEVVQGDNQGRQARKRDRVKVPVPKKVQRARQRRRTVAASPP